MEEKARRKTWELRGHSSLYGSMGSNDLQVPTLLKIRDCQFEACYVLHERQKQRQERKHHVLVLDPVLLVRTGNPGKLLFFRHAIVPLYSVLHVYPISWCRVSTESDPPCLVATQQKWCVSVAGRVTTSAAHEIDTLRTSSAVTGAAESDCQGKTSVSAEQDLNFELALRTDSRGMQTPIC